ncbi:MAG: MFS transporter, partial [Candidatus Adiutricales bacterium]
MSDDTPKLAALVIACLASFTTPFMGSSINLALPTISKEFDMNAIMLGWVATSYLLASAMFLLPFGRAGDIYGRKKIFSYGIAIYTLGSLLSALSTSATMLIISRVIQGLGGSMIFGTSVAILTSVYPPEERGKVLGINVAFVYLGLSLGPFLGGFLTQQLGWRSIFYLNLPIGVIILVLVFWKLKGEWAEARGEKLDIPGSLIYGASLVLLILGLTRLPSLPGVWLALAGLAGLIIFFRWESRAESPVFNVRVFRTNLVFALSNAAALIHYSATFAVTFLLSLFLQYNKGLSPLAAGLILISQPIMMTAFSPLAGRLSDRIEPRMVSSLGMAITCV